MLRTIAIAFTTALLLCLVFNQPAVAEQKGCTTANVAGTYGYEGFGELLATNQFGIPAGPYSSVGTLTFDGHGNLLIFDTARYGDLISVPQAGESATYSVNEKCFVTFTVKTFTDLGVPGPHYKGVFVDNRKGLRTMSLVPGLVVNYVSTTKIHASDND